MFNTESIVLTSDANIILLSFLSYSNKCLLLNQGTCPQCVLHKIHYKHAYGDQVYTEYRIYIMYTRVVRNLF